MLTWLPLWVRAIESLALQARAVCANRNIGCGRSNGVCGPSAAAVVHDLQSIPKTFAIALTAKLTFCLEHAVWARSRTCCFCSRQTRPSLRTGGTPPAASEWSGSPQWGFG